MSHSKVPALYQEPTFGNLVTLPTVHEQNASLLVRAKTACEPVVADLPQDLSKLTPDELEALDGKLNSLQVKLSEGEKISMERRKPFTQYMDKIKSEFTGIEKGFNELFGKFKSTRDAIARERIKRHEDEQRKQNEAIAKKQEAVMFRSYIFQSYNANFARFVALQNTRMNDSFNAKPADELEAYGETLKKWNPKYADHDSICKNGEYNHKYHTPDEVSEINKEVIAELKPQFEASFIAALTKERDRLVELVPSRIKELKESDAAAIAARLKKEADEKQAELDRQLAAQKQQSEAQTEADLLNATFDVASNSEQPIEQTKNTTRKLKYFITSHAAMTAIIQSFVANDMGLMTIAELEKKFSFMITAANKRLNEGVKLEAKGLATIEDVSTRTTKTK